MTELAKKVGALIRAKRLEKAWNQAQLAESCEVPVRTIGRIERGEVDVRISTLQKIAGALGVSMRDLFE